MNKPRLLFLTSRFPYPLEKGDKLRAYHFIRQLSKDFDICLFAIHDSPPEASWLEALRPYCLHIATGHISKTQSYLSLLNSKALPFQVRYFYREKVMQELQAFVQQCQPDAVFCHLIRMAEYARRLDSLPGILDYMDAFSKGMERLKEHGAWWMKIPAGMEWRRLCAYEKEVFDLFDHRIIISAQDKALIPHEDQSQIDVVPNGVDFDFFRPLVREKKYELLFNGHMSYPPNIASALYAAEEILPLVKQDFPHARLLIAGAEPVAAVRKLASQDVTVSGWMDDIREAFACSKIMLAPMLISIGLQNKILQAMAMKIPCVISPMANNALGAVHGEQLFVAENPADYRLYVQRLLSDESLYRSMAEAGYAFVKTHYNWEHAVQQVSGTLQRLLAEGKNPH